MDHIGSLFDPATNGPIARSVGWIDSVATGSLASVIAVVAVAVVGMMMLTGRIEVRRGFTVVIGCFLVFGANIIAKGILGVADHASAVPITVTMASPIASADARRPALQPYDP